MGLVFALVGCGADAHSGEVPADGGANDSALSDAGSAQYTVGGTLSGLTADGLVLRSGDESLTVDTGATTFTFETALETGAPYEVSIASQPTGLTCTVMNGSGTVGSANVTSITVTCAVTTYSVGGTAVGIAYEGVVLSNGAEMVELNRNATSFEFPTPLASGTEFEVTIVETPPELECTVDGGDGTVGSSDITDILVTCTLRQFELGGALSGVVREGLALTLTSSALDAPQTFDIDENEESFVLGQTLPAGAPYAVVVSESPAGLDCTIANGTGTISASNVTNLDVSCTALEFTVRGTLAGTLLDSVSIQLNGDETLELETGDTSFAFEGTFEYGEAYNVTVSTDSEIGDCTITNGSGTAEANVTNVVLTCSNNVFQFDFTASMQTFTVPAGVTSLRIDAFGAQGSNANGAAAGTGGLGGLATGTLAVTPGDVLNIFVGGRGNANLGGYNGGYNGGNPTWVLGTGGGGGGASDVRLNGTDLSDRVIVAGGGGGGGGEGCEATTVGGGVGGAGGGGAGGDGLDAPTSNGVAGGGRGGSLVSGGAAGAGCSGFLGTAGALQGAGGAGQTCCCFTRSVVPGGGGGGGGYVAGSGGGGGSAGTTGCSGNDKGAGGGGGGGSSYTAMLTDASEMQGVNDGDGLVTITID